jgi:predicted CxxxxCH...CXXCH cytochrome family protein
MRITTALMKTVPLVLALAALSGCGKANSSAPATIDAAGRHAVPAGAASWVQQHWVEYRRLNGGSSEVSGTTSCSQCHGSDLRGGTSKVSCFAASFQLDGVNLSCHPNGDGRLGHPSSWAEPASGSFHGNANFNGTAVRGSASLEAECGLCHAISQDVARLGTAPSCLTKDPQWGIACHSGSPALNPQGCVSCHGAPPAGPGAAVAPNRQGRHAAHLNLGIGCSACHTGGGTGTQRHGIGNGNAYLNLSTGYQAQSGAFGYAGGKCSGVACHGGQQTPDWYGSVGMDVATQCTSCHAAASQALPQYNGYFSGKHTFHLSDPNGPRLTCAACHVAGQLTGHFASLATPGFAEGAARGSLAGSLNYQQNVNSDWSCTVACHFDVNGNNPDPNRVIFLWK